MIEHIIYFLICAVSMVIGYALGLSDRKNLKDKDFDANGGDIPAPYKIPKGKKPFQGETK